MGRKAGAKKTAEEVFAMPHMTFKSVEDIMIAQKIQFPLRFRR
jgi:hypothetical protein